MEDIQWNIFNRVTCHSMEDNEVQDPWAATLAANLYFLNWRLETDSHWRHVVKRDAVDHKTAPHICARNWGHNYAQLRFKMPSFFPSNLSNIHPIVECVSTCLASTRNIVCIIAGTSFGHMLYLVTMENHGTMARPGELMATDSLSVAIKKQEALDSWEHTQQ